MTTTETVRFKPGFVAIVTGDFHSAFFFFFFNTDFFQPALLVVPDVHAVTVTPLRPIGMSSLDLLLKHFMGVANS
jgi:THO complex subunit 4